MFARPPKEILNSRLKRELEMKKDEQCPAFQDYLLPASSSFNCCFLTMRDNSMSFSRLDVSAGFPCFTGAELPPVGIESCVLGRETEGEGGLEANPKPTFEPFDVETGLGCVCVLAGRAGKGGLDCRESSSRNVPSCWSSGWSCICFALSPSLARAWRTWRRRARRRSRCSSRARRNVSRNAFLVARISSFMARLSTELRCCCSGESQRPQSASPDCWLFC